MDLDALIARAAQLNQSGRPLYLVGGAVRDRYLGKRSHDLDFCGGFGMRSLAARLADELHGGFYPLDEERGTYRVVFDAGEMVLDFTLLRGADLETDLRARDFTLNAMALDVERQDELIDPLAGLADLRARRLRACGPESLVSDPLRTLRAVRQSVGFGLEIEAQTLEWVRAAAPLLARISPERIRDELFRMLEGDGSAECLRAMDELGLLSFLPELGPLKNETQSAPHLYPVWEHTLKALESFEALWGVLVERRSPGGDSFLGEAAARLGNYVDFLAGYYAQPVIAGRSPRGLLGFAMLYHDCAKPAARSVEESGRIRFLGHDERGAELAGGRARALAFSGEETARVQAIIAGHMRVHLLANQPLTPRAIYRFFRDTGAAGIDICLLSLADTLATYGETLPPAHWRAELAVCEQLCEARFLRVETAVAPPRLVDGNELMRVLELRPGPAVGRLLEAIREAQVEGEIQTPSEALEFARRLGEDLV